MGGGGPAIKRRIQTSFVGLLRRCLSGDCAAVRMSAAAAAAGGDGGAGDDDADDGRSTCRRILTNSLRWIRPFGEEKTESDRDEEMLGCCCCCCSSTTTLSWAV